METSKAAEKLSEAIGQYKATLETGSKITGKVSEEQGKLYVICKSSSGSPVCIEFKREDVVNVQGGDGDSATVSVKDNASYVVTVAGVVGREDDLPRGLGSIFAEPSRGRVT